MWVRYAKRAVAWTTVVALSFVCGVTVATWTILAHGDTAGAPLMAVGAKLISASQPAFIEARELLDPLPGEMEFASARRAKK